jgi:hypothetical protein
MGSDLSYMSHSFHWLQGEGRGLGLKILLDKRKCSASECVPKSELLKSLNLGRQVYERKGSEKVNRRGKVTGEEKVVL